jgi:cyclophilin family peptidyl-prolyl cis-trans isomerase
MNRRISRRSLWLATLITGMSAAPQIANATVVEFQTVMGNFEVNLYDTTTPITVTNFLSYVNNGNYTNSVFHRSVPGFIVQGGGFSYEGVPGVLPDIPARPAILNEPILSNVTGTIAMAKFGNDPNSATNQWFFNLANNSANLDLQNGGFTAFGEVVGNGMDVVNAIAALPRFNFGGASAEIPLQNYTPPADFDANNLIIITAIIVTDSTADSAGLAGLNPPVNTLINAPAPPPPTNGGGGGGGSLSLFALLGLLLTYRLRRA